MRREAKEELEIDVDINEEPELYEILNHKITSGGELERIKIYSKIIDFLQKTI